MLLQNMPNYTFLFIHTVNFLFIFLLEYLIAMLYCSWEKYASFPTSLIASSSSPIQILLQLHSIHNRSQLQFGLFAVCHDFLAQTIKTFSFSFLKFLAISYLLLFFTCIINLYYNLKFLQTVNFSVLSIKSSPILIYYPPIFWRLLSDINYSFSSLN